MAGYGPLERIDGPPPIRPTYGLLQTAESPVPPVRIVPDADGDGIERFLNGAEVYPYPTDLGGIFDTCGAGSSGTSKAAGGVLPHPQFGAVTIFLPETCTSYKVWDQAEFKARAVAVLGAVEGALIERELLAGDVLPLNPHLADGNGTFPNLNAATGVVNGLALLEGEIAKSGRQGVIHVSPQVAFVARSHFEFDDKTGTLRTINGTAIVPGYGYVLGAHPATHPAASGTQEWIYASGPIDIRRSEVFTVPDDVSQALERGTGGASTGRPNSITYRAERHYLLDWDTAVQAAVLVDKCFSGCGS